MPKILEGKITDISHKGLGVLKTDSGKVYFIEGAWPGDEGKFEVTKDTKRYGFGKINSLTTSSVDRRKEVYCSYHGHTEKDCGGCPWMMVSYHSQLAHKDKLVLKALTKNNLVEEKFIKNLVPSPEHFNYRNRAQFKTDGVKLGFVSKGTKKLIDVVNCKVLSEACNNKLTQLRTKLPNYKWSPPKGFLWNFIEITDTSKTFETNRRLPFQQGNEGQNSQLKEWLGIELKTLETESEAVELFCGSGNFSETLNAEENIVNIHAYELNAQAINELNNKKYSKVSGSVADLYKEKELDRIVSEAANARLLFLDPPREGFPKLDRLLKKMKHIRDIIYISCDLDTFSKDLKSLENIGYRATLVQPFDMFPNTPHIEIAATICLPK